MLIIFHEIMGVGMLNADDCPLSNHQMKTNQTTETGQD